MIKAMARGPDGRVLVVIGISADNVDHLKAGDPIYFDPAELKIRPGEVIGGITLFYGATDAELTKTIRGPQTDVQVIPKGDERPQ